jgi:hypothetical protein
LVRTRNDEGLNVTTQGGPFTHVAMHTHLVYFYFETQKFHFFNKKISLENKPKFPLTITIL